MKKGQVILVMAVVAVSIGATFYMLHEARKRNKKQQEGDKKQTLGQAVSDSLKLAPL